MRTNLQRDERVSENALAVRTSRQAGARGLLALQRTAGNSAVTTLVQRRGDDRCPCSDQETAEDETAAQRLVGVGAAAVVSRQVASPGGGNNGHDPCLDLLQAIIELLDGVAKRFRDAQDDIHELFKYHRHINESHPDHGSWDGHRDRFYQERNDLKRKIAEWDANDDCGGFVLSPQQQEDLQEAREFGQKEFPSKPARALREAEESEQESTWDKLRGYLPGWVVQALIVLGVIAIAALLLLAFATGVGEVALACVGLGLVLGVAIKSAARASGVRDTSPEA